MNKKSWEKLNIYLIYSEYLNIIDFKAKYCIDLTRVRNTWNQSTIFFLKNLHKNLSYYTYSKILDSADEGPLNKVTIKICQSYRGWKSNFKFYGSHLPWMTLLVILAFEEKNSYKFVGSWSLCPFLCTSYRFHSQCCWPSQ